MDLMNQIDLFPLVMVECNMPKANGENVCFLGTFFNAVMIIGVALTEVCSRT